MPKNINNKDRKCVEASIDPIVSRMQQFAHELLKGANHVTGLTKTAGSMLDRAAVLLVIGQRAAKSSPTGPVPSPQAIKGPGKRAPGGKGDGVGNSPLMQCQERMAFEAASMLQAATAPTKPPRGGKKRRPAGTNGGTHDVESQIAIKLAAVLEIADRLAKAEVNALSVSRSAVAASRPATHKSLPRREMHKMLRIVSIIDNQRRVTIYVAGPGAPEAARSVNLRSIWGRTIFRPVGCVALTAKEVRSGAPGCDATGRAGNFCGDIEFAQAGRLMILRQIEHISTRRYGAGCLGDPEYVHEMRVATRRMRAAICVFEDVLELGQLKKEVGQLADVLGQARDLDVFLDFLRQYRDRCKGVKRTFAEEMINSWNLRRRASYRKVEAMMTSAAFGAFISRTHKSFCLPVDSQGGPKSTSAAWKDPLWRQARAILHRELRKMFRYAPDLKQYSPRKQHRLRIAGKRMRYLSEFFLPLYGPQMTELIDYVKDVQAFLGDSHDSELFINHVREYVKCRRDGVPDKSKPLVRSLQQRGRRSLSKAIKVWQKLRGGPMGEKFMHMVDSPRRK